MSISIVRKSLRVSICNSNTFDDQIYMNFIYF